MSIVRVQKVENRLAKLATQPGGRAIQDALKRAKQRVEAARERCAATLEPAAADLAAKLETARANPDRASLDAVYATAAEIFGVAGMLEIAPVAEAAGGLCTLLDRFRETDEPINWSAVTVHVDGLRLLAGGSPGAPAILAGLARVRERFGPDA